MWTDYLKAFLVGGAFCALGQILIDRTGLTPARILTGYVVAGVILGAVGLYEPLAEWAGAGATVPLTGFGNTLARGVREAVAQKGVLGPSPAGLPPPPRGSARPCSSGSWSLSWQSPGKRNNGLAPLSLLVIYSP